jgi:hypothetical protein
MPSETVVLGLYAKPLDERIDPRLLLRVDRLLGPDLDGAIRVCRHGSAVTKCGDQVLWRRIVVRHGRQSAPVALIGRCGAQLAQAPEAGSPGVPPGPPQMDEASTEEHEARQDDDHRQHVGRSALRLFSRECCAPRVIGINVDSDLVADVVRVATADVHLMLDPPVPVPKGHCVRSSTASADVDHGSLDRCPLSLESILSVRSRAEDKPGGHEQDRSTEEKRGASS